MKYKALLGVFFFCSFATANDTKCVSQKMVEYIDVGILSQAYKGDNHGNAIMIGYDGGKSISLHDAYNADDAKGKAILSLLTTALVTNKKITAWGDVNCTYIATVRLSK